jgi:hypothetical protein
MKMTGICENNVIFPGKQTVTKKDHLGINNHMCLIFKDIFLFFLCGTSVAYKGAKK